MSRLGSRHRLSKDVIIFKIKFGYVDVECVYHVGREWKSMDLNKNAFRIVQSLTTENKVDKKRSSAAKAGGLVGGVARAAKLTPERRKDIAVKANATRWGRETSGEKGGGGDGNKS
jgi:hypothetical protein